MHKYKKEIIILSVILSVCALSFMYIKNRFFADQDMFSSIHKIIFKDKNENNDNNYKEAVTAPAKEKDDRNIKVNVSDEGVVFLEEKSEDSEYPYSIPPYFEDDGSIIFDGMTLTELTDKLNKSLTGYMTNTGYFFAEYTKRTGLDPYLSLAVVLLETGCKWKCSTLTRDCNNVGGLKGGQSCKGGSYRKYNTLGEGIDGYLDIIYNNYYLKGMKTPEQMSQIYSAGSPLWAEKVRGYMNEIKAK